MEKVITGALLVLNSQKLSKTYGRRNYAIVTYDKTFYSGGYGYMKCLGLLSWLLTTMAEHDIKIFEFTYKKDFEEAKKMLESKGYISK